MKIRFFLLGVISALIVGAFFYVVTQRSSTTEIITESTTNQSTSNEQESTNTVMFTNAYRGNGVKNTYADKPNQTVTLLANTKEELNLYWAEIFKGALAPPKPTVNFDTQTVVIVMLEQQDKGEHLLTIQDIAQTNDELVVTAQAKGPGNGCPATSMLSRPIHVVITKKIAQSTTPTLQLEKTTAAPCSVPLN